MTPDQFRDAMRASVERLRTELPQKLAETSRQYFLGTFDRQGFDGRGWAPRTRDYPWPILVKSGRLRDTVASSIREATWEVVRLESDTPYGEYHNDGTTRLPQRKFMGESQELTSELEEVIRAAMMEVLENIK